jgi:TolA-binding protein
MIDIRVGPAPSFSEFSSMELLGMMVQSGQAPLEVYLTNLPDGYVNNKQELLDLLKNNSQQQIGQLQQQLQQAQQIMEQMSKAYQQMQKEIANVDTVVQENMRLKTMIADLSSQAIEKQQMAAKSNLQMQQDLQGILNITAGKQKK